MDLLSQRINVTTNGGGIAVGMNANGPFFPATAPPVVREQAAQGMRLMIPLPEPASARQDTAAKRARNAEPGDAEPPNKRKRTTGPSGEAQASRASCKFVDDWKRWTCPAVKSDRKLRKPFRTCWQAIPC